MHDLEKLEVRAFMKRTGWRPDYRPVLLAVLLLINLKVW